MTRQNRDEVKKSWGAQNLSVALNPTKYTQKMKLLSMILYEKQR